MKASAFWTITPNADRQALDALIQCAADRLGIPKPDTSGDVVALPPEQGRVVDALDACDPDWHSRGFLLPP